MSADRLEEFATDLGSAGLFLDFDGTLSEIVPVPSDARPVADAPEVLRDLGRRLAVVALVSGRTARELVDWLGPEVEIWGLHGAERAIGGVVSLAERVAPYTGLMQQVRAETHALASQAPGLLVEDKGVIVALHWRAAPDPSAAARAAAEIAALLAGDHDLAVKEGRAVIELAPRVELSKRAVVLERGAGLRAVAFIGDDTVDLPAFDALDALQDDGATTLRVAVRSKEAPSALLERADLIVDGPSGVVDFLRSLASRPD